MSNSERLAFGWGVRAPEVPGSRVDSPAGSAAATAPQPSAVAATLPAPLAKERLDWAYLGMLAFTAILFFRPQDAVPPLEALHLAELSAIAGLGAMINGRLARREPVLPLTREVIGILLFAGIMLALTPFSVWPGGSLAMLTGLYLKVVLIFLLMAGTLTTPARLTRFAWLIMLASGYLGLRAIFDYARGVNLVESGRIAGSVGGVFNNPNDLALNMVAFLPVALLLAARRGRASGRLIAAIVSAVMFVTIVFTKSRGGFLGLAATLIVLLVQGGKVRRGFGLGVLVATLVSMPLLPSSFWNRMASITDDSEDETGSREARRTVMKEAWQAFLERPLTGVGPGEFKDYNPSWRSERFREAHDVWLQVASENGLPGALVFISLVVMAWRNAWSSSRTVSRNSKRAPPTASAACPSAKRRGPAGDPWSALNVYSTAMTASVVGWIVCATFVSVAYTWTFYYVFGITMATRQIAARLPAEAVPAPTPARPPVAA